LNYIAKDDPNTARNAVQRIRAAVDHLADYPSIGRTGRLPLTRELIVGGTPWVIVYRVREDAVEVIRVLHGAQSWPPPR
jgi:toxin ParE1/3/4